MVPPVPKRMQKNLQPAASGRAWRKGTVKGASDGIWSDPDILAILARRRRGLSAGEIALIEGVTRSSICGLLFRLDRAGREIDPDHFSDEALLSALDAMAGGARAADIGARMGLQRFAVLSLVDVIRADSERAEFGSTVCRDDNMNGALSPGWWRDGIRARGCAA